MSERRRENIKSAEKIKNLTLAGISGNRVCAGRLDTLSAYPGEVTPPVSEGVPVRR